MMDPKEAAQFKRWTAGLPSADLDVDSLIRMMRDNKAYEELCEKLAMILMFGNRELRTAIVTSLIHFHDSACSSTSIDFSETPDERKKKGKGAA